MRWGWLSRRIRETSAARPWPLGCVGAVIRREPQRGGRSACVPTKMPAKINSRPSTRPFNAGPMRMTIPRIVAFSLIAAGSLVATLVHARRRGGNHGEDPLPWLTEAVPYVLLAMLALAVVGALWRYLSRPSAADLARERSMRRLSRQEEKERRRPQH